MVETIHRTICRADSGAILRGVAVLNQAHFDVKFELVSDDLIVEPIGEQRLRVDNLLVFRHSLFDSFKIQKHELPYK